MQKSPSLPERVSSSPPTSWHSQFITGVRWGYWADIGKGHCLRWKPTKTACAENLKEEESNLMHADPGFALIYWGQIVFCWDDCNKKPCLIFERGGLEGIFRYVNTTRWIVLNGPWKDWYFLALDISDPLVKDQTSRHLLMTYFDFLFWECIWECSLCKRRKVS